MKGSNMTGVIMEQQSPAAEPVIYTVSDAARILQLHRMTVIRKIHQGKLQAFRTNGATGSYRIKQTDLDAYMAFREQITEAE